LLRFSAHKFGPDVVNADQSSDLEITLEVKESRTRKVRESPLCLAIPTILPKHSL
jgi:hypothetical protein